MRRATGLKRPYPLQVDVNSDEDEYISRVSFDNGMSKSEFIRWKLFASVKIKKALVYYRKKQTRVPGQFVWAPRKGRKINQKVGGWVEKAHIGSSLERRVP